ncbi:MAG: N-carbamoylputrescine amidase [Rhodobacteraceae bacterium]|nr:N-carbamoylputrescine amidase [Paracoccaceae bacterium]
MSRILNVAAIQTSHTWDTAETEDRVFDLARQAAADGAHLVLPSELFATPYFCKARNASYRDLAQPALNHPLIARFQTLARETDTVIPVSFYERGATGLYNSVAVIDADGSVLGIYRKCHIPDFDGYIETAYFDPGPDGPAVWHTRHLVLGVGICWDQWFPELARAMALQGAELLVYPTAIGSEPNHPEWDTAEQWQIAMRGHAAANLVPVLAANRVGRETDDGVTLDFYGSSFCCDHRAAKIAELDRTSTGILRATLDLDRAASERNIWGTFQTRQPRNYHSLVATPPGPPPVK